MEKVRGLVFFDLDGTLLNAKSKIDVSVARAVKQLVVNGYMPIIATGRTDIEIQYVLDKTGINSVISMNGQHIQYAGKEVFSKVISTDICERMLALTKKNHHELGFYTHKQIRVTKVTPVVTACYRHLNEVPPLEDELLYQKEPINMLLVLAEEGDEEYHQAFPELAFFRNGPQSIDTISKGSSKGQGVKELKKFLNVASMPTYAFGDGLNDLDLFKACDYGIAMGNARNELKEIATYVSSANIDGGIVKGLQHYRLI